MHDNQKINIYNVYRVWRSMHGTDLSAEPDFAPKHKEPFAYFLGGHDGRARNLQDWKLSPEGWHRARLLLGPHAKAVVKAYYAQHPELPTPPFKDLDLRFL